MVSPHTGTHARARSRTRAQTCDGRCGVAGVMVVQVQGWAFDMVAPVNAAELALF